MTRSRSRSRSPPPPQRTTYHRSRSRSTTPPRQRPTSDSRSRSPPPRRRSRSPPRHPRKSGGFRWKDNSTPSSSSSTQHLSRGYRTRSPPAPPPPPTHREQRTSETGTPASSEKPKKNKKKKDGEGGGGGGSRGMQQQEMIIVHVNDRLGTKAAIPCLGSDPVRLFKAQVAARIGREPHEIMLKRQGERPFKDALTLEDYGVSNGVQLDLELDTGD